MKTKKENNQDFGELDRQNTALNLLKNRKIYTKHSLYAKKITEVDVLILNFVWEKKELDLNGILHACAERGIKNQEYVEKVVKKLHRRKLLGLEDGRYHVETDMPTFSEKEVDRLVQGIVIGSPDLFVYTSQSPMGVSSKGCGPM